MDENEIQTNNPVMDETEQVSFPVDLTREEYIRFNLVVSDTTGILRFRKGQMILFSIMALVSLSMVVGDAFLSRTIDPVMILLVLFLAASGGALFFGLPAYVKKAAERAYEQNIMGGHSYFGRIMVYPDRVEKHSSHAVVRLRFQENAVYIETKDMMILLAPGVPAIVLPARCLTAADADRVRRWVLPGIPAPRQRLADRMIPTASEHIAMPIEKDIISEETEHFLIDVKYTRQEFVKIVTDTAGRSFMKMLPFYSGISVLAALIFGFLYNFGIGMISFLLMIGLLFALNVLSVRGRAGRSYMQMPDNGTRIRASFTDSGIIVRSNTTGEAVRLVWQAITRAVERPDCVEFYTPTTLLRIPKRCIEDFNALKMLVDSHIHPASKE